MVSLLVLTAVAFVIGGLAGMVARRHRAEDSSVVMEPEKLDLGMRGAVTERPVVDANEGGGFAFRGSRVHRPVRWSSVVGIGLAVALVAAALAAALYLLGYLISAQLNRVLGS